MKKVVFLRKWAKRASSGRSVEEFERDVEGFSHEMILMTTRAIRRGLKKGAQEVGGKCGDILSRVSDHVVDGVRRAILRANGIEERGAHEKGQSEGLSGR